jgi:fatty-acyl-CoA synthase
MTTRGDKVAKPIMSNTPPSDSAAAIARGIPLEEEPGLGGLTLPRFLREVTDAWSEHEALVLHHGDGSVERWTFAELWERSNEVARALVAAGLNKGEPVGVLMSNRPEWLAACFGTALAGGIMVGLSTFSTASELDYLLRRSAISILLYERQVLAKDFTAMLLELEPELERSAPKILQSLRFPFLRRAVELADRRDVASQQRGSIESWSAFLGRGSKVHLSLVAARASAVTPSDPGILFFSSGSTGEAKGIINAHRAVCIQSWRMKRIFDVEPGLRTWSANGLFWSGNYVVAAGTLAAGGALILQRTFDPAEAIRLMATERVSLPYCWPHQWAQLEEQPEWDTADLSSFRYIDVERNLRRPQKTISSTWLDPRASYGSTETFTISTSFPGTAPREVWEGTYGEALPGNIIKIVDPDSGRLLKRGETGEFAVKGPTLMLGYVGVPREQAFDEQDFYRSGDGGFIDAQGRFVFQGRINDIIKTGGANVSPVEVDWELGSYSGVKICKTTGVPHPTLGEMVVTLIVPEPGQDLSEAEVIAWLKTRIASYKVPRKILLVTESDLNLTGTAKIKPADARAAAIRLLGFAP